VHAKDLFSLSGRIAIVTGGSRGLGKEIAIGLGEAGAKVVITARREEWLMLTYEELKGLGIECLAIRTDISKVEDVERLVAETLQRWGRIDILVNNAGITWGAPPQEMPLDRWDTVLNVNAKGTLICSQEIGKEMIKQGGGNIINVASTTGLLAVDPTVMQAIGYQASKAAIIIMTKQLALEWAKYNIKVNAIAPTFIETPLSKIMFQQKEGFREFVLGNIPLGRIGKPEDVVGAVIYLASDASDLVTGHVLLIDGGWTAH